MTALEQLLESIQPERTWDESAARVDDAVNSFPVTKGVISEWNEFRTCLIRFVRHVELHALRLSASPDVSADFEWGRCVRLLTHECGRNGDKAAFEMARTGNEGGLYAVLKRLSRRIAEQYGESEVAARVRRWWIGLSLDEQFQAMTEYLDRYGHLLPSELTEGSAARIKASFPKVLEEHPRILQRTHRVGR